MLKIIFFCNDGERLYVESLIYAITLMKLNIEIEVKNIMRSFTPEDNAINIYLIYNPTRLYNFKDKFIVWLNIGTFPLLENKNTPFYCADYSTCNINTILNRKGIISKYLPYYTGLSFTQTIHADLHADSVVPEDVKPITICMFAVGPRQKSLYDRFGFQPNRIFGKASIFSEFSKYSLSYTDDIKDIDSTLSQSQIIIDVNQSKEQVTFKDYFYTRYAAGGSIIITENQTGIPDSCGIIYSNYEGIYDIARSLILGFTKRENIDFSHENKMRFLHIKRSLNYFIKKFTSETDPNIKENI